MKVEDKGFALRQAEGTLTLVSAALPLAEGFDGNMASVCKDYVSQVRSELESAVWNGAGGVDVVDAFTLAVDRVIGFVVDVETLRFSRRYARAHQKCSIIAQGGYGRGEMNPWSDVDLLIVYPGRMTPYVETITERLIQVVFDAGLQLGWAVRTPRDCVDQAEGDLTIKTAMLDGRVVGGSPDIGEVFHDSVQSVLLAKDPVGFCRQRMEAMATRREENGGSVFLLEPDIKEGKGGLRDLHSLLWIARVNHGAATVRDLVEAGLASEHEERELARTQEFLLRVRNAAHFLAKFKQDKLSFDAQEQIAERFGYKGNKKQTAVDVFMRDYYGHAAVLARTADDLLTRLTAPPEPVAKGVFGFFTTRSVRAGVDVVRGQLVAGAELFESDPLNALRVFADAQEQGVPFSGSTQDLIRQTVGGLDRSVLQSEEAVAIFMSILRSGERVYETLGEMNRLGVLGAIIPEFGRIFCMVQHDFYHVYTVDEHSLIGIRELENVRAGEYEEDSPLLTQVMRECDRPEILFLGMMFHDIGKGYGGDHDERGAVLSRSIGRRLGLHLDDRRALEFLVRNHLLMSTLAQTRDIEDPDLIDDFVKQVGTVENLRNLYLLTFADMRAVGPQIWNGWRDQLLSELYLRAIDAFETGAATEANMPARLKRARARLIERVEGDANKEAFKRFLATMPPTYVLANTDERIDDHWSLYESLGTAVFRPGVKHFAGRGFTELTVCTYDTDGLFARLTGVLSACGLNIVGAKIVTSTENVVIDTFRIDHAGSVVDPNDPEIWALVFRDMENVLANDVDVQDLVTEAKQVRPVSLLEKRARSRVSSEVGMDNRVSRKHTVIDVYAADRPGLLFSLARTMYELGLTIHFAKINTYVRQAVDVFYVTDLEDRKICDEARQEEVREVLVKVTQPSEGADASESEPATA